MNRNLLLVATLTLSAGCGNSGNADDTDSIGSNPDGGARRELAAGHADPCTNMPQTDYPNDELCLEPPPPDVGFQLHFGPRDYDDPAAMAPFVVPVGGEDVKCVFLTTPNTEDRYFIEYHARERSGTHHMITFMSDTSPETPEQGTVQDCNMDSSFRFVLGSQAALGPEGGSLDVPLPGNTAPENEGLATKLLAHTKSFVQLHYVNTTESPLLREAWINVIYTPSEEVKGLVDPIFFIGGLGMDVPPHTEQTITADACGLADDQQDQIRILGLTAHAHAHTTNMKAYVDRQDGTRQLIYQSYDWSDPLNAMFDSIHAYPDPANGSIDGAYSGILTLKRGDTMSWQCDVVNTLDTSLRFANEAYTAEMCNLFGFVTPGRGTPWSCLRF